MGPFGELSTSTPGAEVPGVAPEVAPNVSARGADDVDRGVSDAESVGVMNFENPEDGTARQIQRPVKLRSMGMQVFDHGVQLVSKGVVEPRVTKGKDAKSLGMVRRSQSYRGITASLKPETEPVKRRWNSVETVVTKSVFAHLIPAKGVDFPSCEKVVKMTVKDLDTLG